jgi:hypothetical protein
MASSRGGLYKVPPRTEAGTRRELDLYRPVGSSGRSCRRAVSRRRPCWLCSFDFFRSCRESTNDKPHTTTRNFGDWCNCKKEWSTVNVNANGIALSRLDAHLYNSDVGNYATSLIVRSMCEAHESPNYCLTVLRAEPLGYLKGELVLLEFLARLARKRSVEKIVRSFVGHLLNSDVYR